MATTNYAARYGMMRDSISVGIGQTEWDCAHRFSCSTVCRDIRGMIEDVQDLARFREEMFGRDTNLLTCLDYLHESLDLAKQKDWRSCMVHLQTARSYL